MAEATRTCHLCGTVVGAKAFCPTCTAAFPNRRDVATMTAEERAQEFENWVSVLEIDFPLMHQRLEELAGRSVWTHELAHPEDIVAEIRAQQPAGFDTVLDRFQQHYPDKPIIVVDPSWGRFHSPPEASGGARAGREKAGREE